MKHWEERPEEAWKNFHFNLPYEKGLKRLNEEVLGKTNFDPACLWQWGTMQALAIIEVLKDVEKHFGAEGQKVVREALKKIGLDIGRQILKGLKKPDEFTEEEFISFYVTVINRIVYASLEDPKIDQKGQVSFDILWCPHQDHYRAFDCRVQRYFVQGMLEALDETGWARGYQVRFDSTIPAGASTCHFTIWKTSEEEKKAWEEYTKQLEEKALRLAEEERID